MTAHLEFNGLVFFAILTALCALILSAHWLIKGFERWLSRRDQRQRRILYKQLRRECITPDFSGLKDWKERRL